MEKDNNAARERRMKEIKKGLTIFVFLLPGLLLFISILVVFLAAWGITAGINYTLQNDILTLNGTATGSSGVYMSVNRDITEDEKLSFTILNGTSSGISPHVQWIRNGTTYYTPNYNYQAGDRIVQIYFNWSSGATALDYKIAIQLEKGLQATEFEP